MRKIYIALTLLLILALSPLTNVYAKDLNTEKLSISITSPSNVRDYPGKQTLVKAEVKNNTDKPIKDLLVYITMADTKKNMTVNLEDYSADKPIKVDILNPGETKIVELPIRFVYTSNYYLYTTAVSKEYNQVISSDAIPIKIMGNTKVDKNMVLAISYIEPILLVLGTVFIMLKKKYSKKA
ncbi:hypothetical protein [Clostridium sp. YIM B02551]|uniref:hypothetical protein n=1 Tax=Clostridium sp. YIM B02551 TaxID=2910679 RepID=UPI001EEB47B3|nr:hypothetical protein [Clostridium sp. YIM B02551]